MTVKGARPLNGTRAWRWRCRGRDGEGAAGV